ncbi:Hypothetical predicted protein [Octopus vulgaris]|uniref:Uncharacterized protein n=1 Tax=Octopus vulgaris TaxID=6645 RepID=A0AA36BP36_OCTVU|nr:Hypothetical predicted protein [Octopus vulgaris]
MDFYIQPKRRPHGQKGTRKLNITKLKNQLTVQDLQSRMDSKLLDIRNDQSSIDEQWESFRDTVHSIALETLGQFTRNHQDWFNENDQEIQNLLEGKRRLLRAHQNDTTCTAKKAAFNNIRSTVQAKLSLMQDSGIRRQTRHQEILRGAESCLWTAVLLWINPPAQLGWNLTPD